MMQSCVQFITKGLLVSEKTEINAVGSGKSGCVQRCGVKVGRGQQKDTNIKKE